MSFIGKALKKVFSFGKKIVGGIKKAFGNSWFRTAFLIGATLFTSGLGGAGFNGFKSAMTAAQNTGSSTIGSFFSAVGSTISTGFSNITSSVSGLFKPDAAPGELPVGDVGTKGGETILTDVVKVGPPEADKEAGEQKGFLSRVFGTLFEDTKRGDFMRSAIVGGISFWAKQQEADEQRRRYRNRTIAGGKAFGGPEELPVGHIRKPFVSAAPQEQQTTAPERTAPSRSGTTTRTPQSATLLSAAQGRATQIRRPQRQGTPLLGAA